MDVCCLYTGHGIVTEIEMKAHYRYSVLSAQACKQFIQHIHICKYLITVIQQYSLYRRLQAENAHQCAQQLAA